MEGYTRTAAFMHENNEVTIFRHFGMLSAKNLLYLQAEIVHLELELSKLAEQDKEAREPNRPNYASDWFALSHSERDGHPAQWQKVLEIRARIKEYHSSLEQHAFFLKLGAPANYDLELLQNWISEKSGLRGNDLLAWEDASDLVLLSEKKYKDPFSRILRNHLIPIYHRSVRLRVCRILKRQRPITPDNIELESNATRTLTPQTMGTQELDTDSQKGFTKYNDGFLTTTIEFISTFISSMLPVSSILILYFVTSQKARLGIILGYTALFSIALAILTNARRVEIFAAVSTFAAVQVVFISASGCSIASGIA